MIVVLKQETTPQDLERLLQKLRDFGCRFQVLKNGESIIRVQSNQHLLSKDFLLSQPGVKDAFRVSPAYTLARKTELNQRSLITVGDHVIGGAHFVVIAGPCAVESEEQITGIARELARFQIRFIRGGAFKPRTSPYNFQGLGENGLRLMRKAADQFGMKMVTEAVSSADVPLVAEYADLVQIGTRNMQNFRLLKSVGKQKKPVLLKRGMTATLDEFLLAAEYILQEGNSQVILCERGIRTFETATRNTLDISAIPMIKQLSHLPILVDPSHASGRRSLILPLSRAALAAGADGLMIEVHDRAEAAKSDGPQSINFSAMEELLGSLRALGAVLNRELL